MQFLQNNKKLLGPSYAQFFKEIEEKSTLLEKLEAAKVELFKHFAADPMFDKITFIITRGDKTTLILYGGKIEEVSILSGSEVVSTNGAGDAVVAGVVAAGSIPISKAVEFGHLIARRIIEQDEPNFSDDNSKTLNDLRRFLEQLRTQSLPQFEEPSKSQNPISSALISTAPPVSSSIFTTSDIVSLETSAATSHGNSLAKQQQSSPLIR